MAEEAPRQGQHSMQDGGATDYRPVSWDEVFGAIEEQLRGLHGPDGAIFYTSGRTSSEAAFGCQLLVLGLGTNSLTDCFKMCQESGGNDLTAALGVGKGLVSLEDLRHQELILIAGRAPGGDQPRMLTAREKAKQDGAITVVINPSPEAGWLECCNPRTVRGPAGRANHLADDYLPIRIGGDRALFQALGMLPMGLPGGTGVDTVPAPRPRGTPRRELPHGGLDAGGMCRRPLPENKPSGAAGFRGRCERDAHGKVRASAPRNRPLGMQCRPGFRPEGDHFRGNRFSPWAGSVIPQHWFQAERIP